MVNYVSTSKENAMRNILSSPIGLDEIHQSFDHTPIDHFYMLKQFVEQQTMDCLITHTWEIGLMVKFDWPQWEEGGQFYGKDEWNFSDKDLVFCYKFLTAVIRNGRFTQGALEHILETGKMIGLIDRLIELKLKYPGKQNEYNSI